MRYRGFCREENRLLELVALFGKECEVSGIGWRS